MLSIRQKQLTYAVALADGLLLSGMFAAAFLIRSNLSIGTEAGPELSAHLWILFLALPLFLLGASYRGLYTAIHAKRDARLLWDTLVVFVVAGSILGTLVFLFQARTVSRAVFFMFLTGGFVLILGQRILIKLVLLHRHGRLRDVNNIVIVGTSEEAVEVGNRLLGDPDSGLHLVGYLRASDEEPETVPEGRILGTVDELQLLVEEDVIDEVVFVVPPSQLLRCNEHIGWCEEVGVAVHLKIDFFKTLFSKTHLTTVDGIPMLSITSTPRDPLSLFVKRSLDLTLSLLGLLLGAPLMLGIAAAVRLTSRGPVIYAQDRVGLNGRIFRFYKFRSMYVDADERKAALCGVNEMSGPVFKMRNDPRVTPVGRWIRKFSLDELPQLWNVLKGDMSLVGPRPPVPEEVVKYERWQRRRLSMKPGLTCLWQISGRNRIGFDEWMKLDLDYIDNWSLKLDLAILLRTVPAVLTAKGAH